MARPRNWHGTGASHDLLAAAKDEGIPLLWVPPADVIRRLNAAGTAEQRSAVLLAERQQILAACVGVVDECMSPEIAGDRHLVGKAVEALVDGHDEAGMALATSVGEGLAHWAIQPRVQAFKSELDQETWTDQWKRVRGAGYRRIDLVGVAANDVEPWDFPRQVMLAPIHRFFIDYRPGDATRPEVMSRHVVAHRPTPDHMTALNGLKAVMMVTGILREQEEWVRDVGETLPDEDL